MGTVVVLGSLITDLVARASRFPLPGEALIGNDFAIFLGGKGINQAITAARMGARVTLVGRVGMDTFGDAFFPELKRENIDSTYVERDPHIGTGVSVIIIAEESGQNAIVAAPLANLAVPGETVEAALRTTRAHRAERNDQGIFLAQCETSRVSYETGLHVARQLGMTTILNVAPIPRELPEDTLFALVDILIVNEVEAAILSQKPVSTPQSAQGAAEDLLAKGPQHVIVTLGAQGSVWSRRDGAAAEHHFQPPFKVQGVDATAAGDAFCGTLAASLADGSTMKSALLRASAAGALTASRKGAIIALPTLAEVEALLTQQSA
ncbi:MAG: ribokinase [Ktedonobacteraceae bacterium]|nr:ribokinase [Ktedonobacteraceae bacterium]